MGNEPNICCDNTRHEVNWFEPYDTFKPRTIPPKDDLTQSTIPERKTDRDYR